MTKPMKSASGATSDHLRGLRLPKEAISEATKAWIAKTLEHDRALTGSVDLARVIIGTNAVAVAAALVPADLADCQLQARQAGFDFITFTETDTLAYVLTP